MMESTVRSARDQLTAAGPDSFAYDPAGNLTERADGTLQVFDPAQQLCWTSPTAAGGDCATPAGDATTYAYDERGNRVGVDRPDGSSGEYGYDAENRMVSVADGGPAPISSMTGAPVVGDFDADGASDVFWYSPGAAPEWVSWGTGRDRFGREASSYSVSGTYVPLSGDFNGDGHGDIFWYAPGAGADSVWFWFADGAGGYTTRFFPVSGTYAPVAGDFDGDGFDDVYWYAPGAGADAVWWGNASVDDSAAFTSTPVTRGGAFEPVAGDFDGNGVDDIFWYEPGAGADTVWFGAGARNSWLARPQTVTGAYDLIAGDVDGDGRDDVVFYSPTAVDTLWWGTDANSFGPASQKPLTLGAGLDPAAGDFDGDGRDDLLLYAPTGDDTTWWGTTRTAFATDTGLAPDPVDAAYSYDTTGLRHAKTVNGVRSEFTWDRSGGLPLLLAEHHGTGTTYLIHGPGGTPLYQITPGGDPLYLHHDHQGSTRLVTHADGTTAGTATYSPYGATLTNTTGHQLLAGYTGEYTDPETGHIYLRARYHDPATGQFTTRDPIVGATAEPYSYAGGDSVNRSDPSGLCWGPECVWEEAKEAAGRVVEGGRRMIDDVREATPDPVEDFISECVPGLSISDVADSVDCLATTAATTAAIGNTAEVVCYPFISSSVGAACVAASAQVSAVSGVTATYAYLGAAILHHCAGEEHERNDAIVGFAWGVATLGYGAAPSPIAAYAGLAAYIGSFFTEPR